MWSEAGRRRRASARLVWLLAIAAAHLDEMKHWCVSLAAMKRIFVPTALMLFLAVGARAQDGRPNFSGTWTLDVVKSDFGPSPPPESLVIVIEHNEPNIKTKATQKGPQGETTNERNLTTDGKENPNKVRTMMGEQDVKSTSKWDSRKLATAYKLDIQGMVVEVSESWELSDEGKVLTVVRDLKTPQGDFAQKMVFSKQGQAFRPAGLKTSPTTGRAKAPALPV